MSARQHVVAYAFDKRGRILAIGRNNYSKSHPLQKFYASGTSNPDRIYLHAEMDALIKATRRCRNNRSDRIYSLHVERISPTGERLLAKPCECCQRALKSYGVKKVSWTDNKDL